MAQQRHEMYRPIHKAIRYLMFSTAQTIGITDFTDKEAAERAIGAIDLTIGLLEFHAKDEEEFIHPEIEKRAPGLIAAFEGDHRKDETVYAELNRIGAELRGGAGERAAELGTDLYGKYNAFVGEYMGHLAREEDQLQGALWEHFTDEELGAIEGALMAAAPPDMMAQYVPVICASLNPDELSIMLGGVKAMAPPEAFAGMLHLAEQHVPPQNWPTVLARVG